MKSPDGVAPLSDLPADKRAEIERLAASPEPPPRWLSFELCQVESRAWYEWHWRRGLEPRDDD